MSVFSGEELSGNTLFRDNVFVWWETNRDAATRYPQVTMAELTELFTRYSYVKAASTATYSLCDENCGEAESCDHTRTLFSIGLDKDSPILAINRDDRDDVSHIATHGNGFAVHAPQIWLAETVEPLIAQAAASGITVESAIHLGKGRYSGVTLSHVDATVAADMQIRRTFSVVTSQTGELPSRVCESQTIVVCDNTAAAAASGRGVSFKHTANSEDKLPLFRDALDRFIAADAAEATRWVGMLADTVVTAEQYAAILENWAPTPKGESDSKGAKNQTTRRKAIHDELWKMWADPREGRVAQWSGTALGAYQALSTWDHYSSQTRGQTRATKLAIARLTNRADDESSTHSRVLATLARSLDSEAVKSLITV